MRILVLGGTSFVGRHFVEAAVAAGHHLTLFNRGRSAPQLFADLEQRRGDRDTGDYASLADGSWDAVVDVNGYVPRHVQESLAALEGRYRRYLFVSTVSVYDARRLSRDDEQAERLEPLRDTEVVDGDTYGRLKVACEDDVQALGDRATVLRPGIVAGPHDPTDRFTAWVRRCALGGPVPVPDQLDQPTQVVDARDLAVFALRLLTDDRSGAFDGVGPVVSLRDLVTACGADEILAVPIDRWREVVGALPPLVVPAESGMGRLFQRSGAGARAAGLENRPYAETAEATLKWDTAREQTPIPGMPSPQQEAELV